MTWRCAAHQPRFAPFHLRFHPLLRRSFGFSFCSLSFSPFASSYLRCTYFVNEVPLLSVSPLSLFLSLRSLFVSFFFSRAPPRSTDISITTIFARRLFSNFRITILSTASNIPRVPLSTFPPSDFTLVNDSAKFLFGRRQGSARRFIGQTTRRTASYYRDRRAAKSSPATSDITLRPENCFSDHLRPPI